tara:strand:- start:243 stop:923 length:681 start_codon:yes stop_codon:yes gene_type:complete
MIRRTFNSKTKITKLEAISLMETSYLAATTSLIYVALFYIPFISSFLRIALPLPLALLQLRRKKKSAFEGTVLSVLLLTALLGPVRGPMLIFPYGLLAIWLGIAWQKKMSWWFSWIGGAFIGTFGFLIRVFLLSFLLGENLWVLVIRASSSAIEAIFSLFNLIGWDIHFVPDFNHLQIVAVFLIILQELVYVITLHAIAYWIFPRLKAPLPEPPSLLNSLVALDSF